MTKVEYRKIVWGILKGYSDELDIEDLEELLELIMAIPIPKEKNPYVGMATRG
ncbi:hypothetical protein ES705_08084 [subsurface metagenome]